MKYLIDIDNTIIDILSGLKMYINGYDPKQQKTYNFSDNIRDHVFLLLDTEHFYKSCPINKEVYEFVKSLIADNHEIEFYSACINPNMAGYKKYIINDIFGEQYKIHFYDIEDELNIDFDKYDFIIDDNPNKFEKIGYDRLIKVCQPYNKAYPSKFCIKGEHLV